MVACKSLFTARPSSSSEISEFAARCVWPICQGVVNSQFTKVQVVVVSEDFVDVQHSFYRVRLE